MSRPIAILPGVLTALRKRRAAGRVGFWWHSIDLGDGVVTPGHKSPDLLAAEWDAADPGDLTGRTVLDIGGWDGYFSFAAERAGAERVALLDHYVWSLDLPGQQADWQESQERGVEPAPYEHSRFWHPDTLPGKAGFDIAREALGSSVEPIVADFANDDVSRLGQWDVVLFLGVLYHLTDPFGALTKLRGLTRELAVIETQAIVVDGHEDEPLWRFFPGADFNADPSNWWAPNLAGLHAALTAAGFSNVTVRRGPTGTEPYRAVVHARP
jgi:tRNA (mo5U34)-methyltransferase